MSLALIKRLNDTPSELYYTLVVVIANDHPLRVFIVHQSFILQVFGVTYSIDLVPILLRDTNVILYGLIES